MTEFANEQTKQINMMSFPCYSLTFLLMSGCFTFASGKSCRKLDTCSCEMDDGSGVISLHDLDSKDGVPR